MKHTKSIDRPLVPGWRLGQPSPLNDKVVAPIAAGSWMFEGAETDLALELVEGRVFEGGAVALRYRVLSRHDHSDIGEH